jgi:hypothetical protein
MSGSTRSYSGAVRLAGAARRGEGGRRQAVAQCVSYAASAGRETQPPSQNRHARVTSTDLFAAPRGAAACVGLSQTSLFSGARVCHFFFKKFVTIKFFIILQKSNLGIFSVSILSTNGNENNPKNPQKILL